MALVTAEEILELIDRMMADDREPLGEKEVLHMASYHLGRVEALSELGADIEILLAEE